MQPDLQLGLVSALEVVSELDLELGLELDVEINLELYGQLELQLAPAEAGRQWGLSRTKPRGLMTEVVCLSDAAEGRTPEFAIASASFCTSSRKH